MAKFIQDHQNVINQVNAELTGDIYFRDVHNKTELVAELRKFLIELYKEMGAGNVKQNISIDIESCIAKAIVEIEKTKPKKKSILDHIEGAKSLLDGITSATGLVTALMEAVKIARGLFL